MTQTKKPIQSKNQSSSGSSVKFALTLRNKGNPSVPQYVSYNAARTKPTVHLQPSTSTGAMSKQRGRPKKDSALKNPEEAYKPQREPKATKLDESYIGKDFRDEKVLVRPLYK